VLLNGRPFKVEFGGLPKPIIVRDKKHFIRFSVLPRGVRSGYVKIAGMKGEGPIGSPPPTTSLLPQKPKIDTTPIPSQPANLEHESTSQDDSDLALKSKSGRDKRNMLHVNKFVSMYSPIFYSNMIKKNISQKKGNFCMKRSFSHIKKRKNIADLQLDMLSSVLPSAMAPASGLSYQAEPAENSPTPPAPTLPLNMNELFQRLVETGIVPSPAEQKKQEEEEKKKLEIIPVSFDKPETLKV
jgi:pre-mRNA cleavage complex 2 protein Pcf11